MRQAKLVAVVLAVLLALSMPAMAEYAIPHSVTGSGGGGASGRDNTILGTVGQPMIGVVAGPRNINEIGFWYQPGWILTGVEDGDLLPTAFRLWQNHPNPFNPVTTVRFAIPERTRVTMTLYDVAGREVRTLIDDEYERGYHQAVLNASGLASGVYFCRMAAGSFSEARKLVLLK